MLMKVRQQTQYEHDMRHHFDILSLSRADRLKHYGLHFAKYAGRLARGSAEAKSRAETLVDAMLVALSAANALNQALPDGVEDRSSRIGPSDLAFTDFSGRFADACEKIDHLEDFRTIALDANREIVQWIMCSAEFENLDLDAKLDERRRQLSVRSVFAKEV